MSFELLVTNCFSILIEVPELPRQPLVDTPSQEGEFLVSIIRSFKFKADKDLGI